LCNGPYEEEYDEAADIVLGAPSPYDIPKDQQAGPHISPHSTAQLLNCSTAQLLNCSTDAAAACL